MDRPVHDRRHLSGCCVTLQPEPCVQPGPDRTGHQVLELFRPGTRFVAPDADHLAEPVHGRARAGPDVPGGGPVLARQAGSRLERARRQGEQGSSWPRRSCMSWAIRVRSRSRARSASRSCSRSSCAVRSHPARTSSRYWRRNRPAHQGTMAAATRRP
ncbi:MULTISPECIES: hypothetical protein [unclassified Streptomyces]|uniref:hypothetical protein n=1 Tax=unclassified Streptomyces TaxID=2593676 RepID=UPI0034230C74